MARGRKLQCLEDYKRALKNKYGLGEGDTYKPWFRVQDVKSQGLSSKIQGIKVDREHHTLTQVKTEFFYLAEFSDSVIDIREQFPLLPLNLSSSIAQSLDIKHPRVPATGELKVVTTDFLITRLANGKTVYEAFCIQSEDELKKPHILEKIELERVWWELLGVAFNIYTGSESTRIQSQNIAWATAPIRNGFSLEQQLKNNALCLLTEGKHTHENICNMFIDELNVDSSTSNNLLCTLIGEKLISVDLSYSILESGIVNILKLSSIEREHDGSQH